MGMSRVLLPRSNTRNVFNLPNSSKPCTILLPHKSKCTSFFMSVVSSMVTNRLFMADSNTYTLLVSILQASLLLAFFLPPHPLRTKLDKPWKGKLTSTLLSTNSRFSLCRFCIISVIYKLGYHWCVRKMIT